MKVAIVEDEIRIREGITKLLMRNYPDIDGIYEAKSGSEGIDIICRYEPDLVITDIRMEPMDGIKMLETLLEQEKHAFKTIILSAYSDFGYAKAGIKLGISGYLVKPVDVTEFHEAMRRVKVEIERDNLTRQENPAKLRSFETILAGMLSGQLVYDSELEIFIKNTYKIYANTEIALVCVYLGEHYGDEAQLTANIVSSTLTKGGYKDYRIVFLPQEQKVLFAVYGNTKKLEKYFQYNITKKIGEMSDMASVFGFTVCSGFKQITDGVANIKEYLPWSISLGNGVMISYPKVTRLISGVLVYPVGIEKDSIEALCSNEHSSINDQAEKLLEHLTSKLYSPEAIKKCIIRYLLAILAVVKEVNFTAYNKIDEGELLEAVSKAVTRKELMAVIFEFLELVTCRSEKKVGLLVQKALRITDECYRQGITLEEVAMTLKMTPEHISSQFVKELGVNFSTYIKNLRIKKAKELLLGSDLKLYEIAEQIGYNDAKYFSRVFKEVVGVLPMEYRKMHK